MKAITLKPKKKPAARANGAKRARRVREARAPYAARKGLVVETYGGEPYEYYPLGEFVVAAPGVCGGRPTFKYTRIEAAFVLELLAGGWTTRRIINFYKRPEISLAGIREAIRLASVALQEYPALPLAA